MDGEQRCEEEEEEDEEDGEVQLRSLSSRLMERTESAVVFGPPAI